MGKNSPTHTVLAEAASLMVGDKRVGMGLGESPIERIERNGNKVTIEAHGYTEEFELAEPVLIALPEFGKLPPRQLAARVLGKAVHPFAVNRLFELWPEAQVAVRHGETRHDGADLRFTEVEIWEGERTAGTDPGSWAGVNTRHVTRRATCHPADPFDRRTGIRLAFDRCLREAVRRMDSPRVAGMKRSI